MSGIRTEKQKMLAGRLYDAGDPELVALRAAAAAWLMRYNASLAASAADRLVLLREHLAAVGDGAEIRPPFYCDYGSNITIGPGAYLNFNCVILDVCRVTIGAATQIGPAVQIYAADHPRDAGVRRTGKEFGRAVTIGENVWIGGGAVILPGVTIGDNAIIGAGSVVTRDIPGGAVGLGNPARIRR
jgi:maltose O-acetyltransferase